MQNVSSGGRKEPLSKSMGIYVCPPHVFTSDSLLLADFSAPKSTDTVCDLGTGCGIIPMLMYRDFHPAHITGVELSEAACELFLKTLSESGADCITCVNADLRELKSIVPANSCDLVTVNPPYKKQGAGHINTSDERRNTRHEYSCTLSDVCNAAARLLRWGGRFCICQRPERLCDVFAAMREAKIEPKAMREVAERPGGAPSLVLVAGTRGGKSGLRLLPPLYIKDADGGFSPEADRIFNSYRITE